MIRVVICLMALLVAACGSDGESSSATASSAESGSTAAMVVQRGFLIALDSGGVKSFRISDGQPLLVDQHPRFDSETLFAYRDDLILIGTDNGAEILSISEQGVFSSISFINHARSCDPVVANNTHMFVTLRSGSSCNIGGSQNVLQIYSLENLQQPQLVKEVPMTAPYGMALAGDALYVCYAEGLAKFDIQQPETLQQYIYYPGGSCNDLIYQGNGEAILTSDAGMQLVSLSDERLSVQSTIAKGG